MQAHNMYSRRIVFGVVFVFVATTSVLVQQADGVRLSRKTQRYWAASRLLVADFLREGSSCTRGGPYSYPRCEPKTWCLGTPGRCLKRRQLGQSCGSSQYEVCGRLMNCDDGKCVKKVFRYPFKQLGDSCVKGSWLRCRPGLWCIAAKCRRLVPCGGPCGTPDKICRPGLKCSTIFTTRIKICTRADGEETVLQAGQRCQRGEKPRCRRGLRCGGKRINSVCVEPTRLGHDCSGDFSRCEFGRVCREVDDKKICVVEQGQGGDCSKEFLICKAGILKCVNGTCKIA